MPSTPIPLSHDGIWTALEAALQARFTEFSVVAETVSTNTSLLAVTEPVGAYFFAAQQQSAGRGRRERAWVGTPDSSLMFSLGRVIRCASRDLGGVSLAAGHAVATALRAMEFAVGLKWPNDVVTIAAGQALRKVGGILAEAKTLSPDGHFVVIGVGLNVSGEGALSVDQPISSLQACGAASGIDRNRLAAALIAALMGALDVFERDGLAPFVSAWPAIDVLDNAAIDVHESQRIWPGSACGIDGEGRLRVRAADGSMVALTSAEVSVRKK